MAGPLQVIAVGFGPGADFEGRILAELDRLEGRGVLRVLDVLFVAKDDDGNISQLAVGDDEDLGALLGSVVPLGVATTSGSSDGDGGTGFNPDDALALAGTRCSQGRRWRSCSSSTPGRSGCSRRSPTRAGNWSARGS